MSRKYKDFSDININRNGAFIMDAQESGVSGRILESVIEYKK